MNHILLQIKGGVDAVRPELEQQRRDELLDCASREGQNRLPLQDARVDDKIEDEQKEHETRVQPYEEALVIVRSGVGRGGKGQQLVGSVYRAHDNEKGGPAEGAEQEGHLPPRERCRVSFRPRKRGSRRPLLGARCGRRSGTLSSSAFPRETPGPTEPFGQVDMTLSGVSGSEPMYELGPGRDEQSGNGQLRNDAHSHNVQPGHCRVVIVGGTRHTASEALYDETDHVGEGEDHGHRAGSDKGVLRECSDQFGEEDVVAGREERRRNDQTGNLHDKTVTVVHPYTPAIHIPPPAPDGPEPACPAQRFNCGTECIREEGEPAAVSETQDQVEQKGQAEEYDEDVGGGGIDKVAIRVVVDYSVNEIGRPDGVVAGNWDEARGSRVVSAVLHVAASEYFLLLSCVSAGLVEMRKNLTMRSVYIVNLSYRDVTFKPRCMPCRR